MIRAWAAVPLVAVASAGTSTEPDNAPPAIGEDQFVANCVDLGADDVESSSLCVVGLDGSIEMLLNGLVPGEQIALSPDRDRIAVPSEDEVVVVSAIGEELWSTPFTNVVGLAWTPDGETLLVQQLTDREWSVTLVPVGTKGETREVAAGEVVDDSVGAGIAATPDGVAFVYGARHGDGYALLAVEIETGVAEVVYGSPDFVYAPDVSPNGELVAAVDGRLITVIEIESGRFVRSIFERNAVISPSFSPDGTQLIYVEARGAVEYQDVDDHGSNRVVFDITRGDDETTFPALPTWS